MTDLRLLVVLLCMTQPLAGQTDHADAAIPARTGIQAGNAEYIAAFRRADAKALARVYDAQGARLNQGGVVIRGRSAIAADVSKFLAQVGPVRVSLDTKEVWLMDDKAYETGVWSYTFHPQGKTEQQIGGHYVTVWKLQPQGDWKIWADMGVPGT